MDSTIFRNEKEFIKKLETFISILADITWDTGHDGIIVRISRYHVNIKDKKQQEFFMLWLCSKLQRMGYTESEIKEFLLCDLDFILKRGYSIRDSRCSEDNIIFMCIGCVLCIYGILFIPFFISQHRKNKFCFEIEKKFDEEYKCKIENTDNIEEILPVFDKYFDMI